MMHRSKYVLLFRGIVSIHEGLLLVGITGSIASHLFHSLEWWQQVFLSKWSIPIHDWKGSLARLNFLAIRFFTPGLSAEKIFVILPNVSSSVIIQAGG